jgi:alpha-beta hydrolase superfamily lysophospholipase
VFALIVALHLTADLATQPPVDPCADGSAAAGTGSFVGAPVVLQTPVGAVNGTLLAPAAGAAATPRPTVVLIVAGSGPTDRDGNTPLIAGASSPLRLVAEALARCGIASLRYDKRGIATSRIAPEAIAALRFDDYVDDAAAWVAKLRADGRFGRVVVAGHSEGALIGTIVAERVPGTAVVTLDGAGRSAPAVLHEQLARQFPAPLVARADSMLALLRAGHTVDTIPPDFPGPIGALFAKPVQPYVISWFRYDPAAELARVSAPVLMLQGANDAQVSVDDARRLAAAAGARGRLVVVDSMTHELKLAGPDQASQMRTYTDGSLPIAPVLLRELVAFVRHLPNASPP